jgi:serine/threonine protein kinase
MKISAEAIDFIKRLLDPDPTTRAEVKEALKHKFLLKAK